MSTEYRVRFHASDLHAETVAECDSADEAREDALDRARTVGYGGAYYTAEEREEGGAWAVIGRWTREDADEDEADEDADEEEPEPPSGAFEGARMDDITVHEVYLHGGEAVAIVEPGYAYDDDGALAGPIVDARSCVRRCLPSGWDVDGDAEVGFSAPYQDALGQPRERWTFALKRVDA